MQIGLACIGVVAGAADNSQAKITFEYDNDYCIFDCLLDCNAPETMGKPYQLSVDAMVLAAQAGAIAST